MTNLLKKIILSLSIILVLVVTESASSNGAIPIPLEAAIKKWDRKWEMKQRRKNLDPRTFPSIEQDLDAAVNKDRAVSRAAIDRLMVRGTEIAPYIIDALENLNNTKHAENLYRAILKSKAVPGTEKYIIEETENRYRVKNPLSGKELYSLYARTFISLSKFKDQARTMAYADGILDNANLEPAIHARALVYYAKNPVQQAGKWVDKYAVKSSDPEVYIAALYLGGILGRQSVKTEITSILKLEFNL